MNDKILIGIILKPQGILGEVKVKDLTMGFDAVKNIKSVFISGNEHKVLNLRSFGGALYLSLSGIYDRNIAESFRGKEIYALRKEIEVSEGEFFIVDVIGCSLRLSSGKILGEIIDIESSRYDIYKINTAEGVAVFPMLKELEPVYDLDNKVVTVNAKRFTEVVMYED